MVMVFTLDTAHLTSVLTNPFPLGTLLQTSPSTTGERHERRCCMLTIQHKTFEGTFPFPPHYHMVHGCAMHFIPTLSQTYRCLVPDHLGMGKSDVPQDLSFYRLDQRIAHFEALVLHLDLRDITLVMHDWEGPVGLGFATRHRERIKRLVLLNTWAFAPWPGGSFPRLLELIRSPRGDAFVLQKNGYLEPPVGRHHVS
jgi:pimeloyl-ACP methyl ester carboxylesterase